MAVSDARRVKVSKYARAHWGEESAEVLMELVLPAGQDMATKANLDSAVGTLIARMDRPAAGVRVSHPPDCPRPRPPRHPRPARERHRPRLHQLTLLNRLPATHEGGLRAPPHTCMTFLSNSHARPAAHPHHTTQHEHDRSERPERQRVRSLTCRHA